MSDPVTSSPDGGAPDTTGWWHHLVAAALVGTARRPVPPLALTPVTGVEPRRSAGTEAALLDAAALGGMMRAAGSTSAPDAQARRAAPDPADDVRDAPAPPETRPEAPRRASQLLLLVLVQNPAGPAAVEPLVRRWCTTAHRRGYRLPHTLLPQVLELGRTRPGVRDALPLVLGERGRWLARILPGAGWVAGAEPASAHSSATDEASSVGDLPDPVTWAQLGDAPRLTALRAARKHDPALGRQLVASTWGTDPARTRKEHLEALAVGLEDADEDLLERALDDRAASVRTVAASLLDGLPGSARAGRMADRLRPLLRLERRPDRTRLEVGLPEDPDPAGVRDGLGAPPRGLSARGYWVLRVAAGAPLSVWTDASGQDPGTTYDLLSSDEARAGILQAVRSRGDPGWARALARWTVARGGALDPGLVELLDPTEAERLVLSGAGAGGAALAAVVQAAPSRWSRTLTLGVLDRCRRAAAQPQGKPELVLQQLLARPANLHRDALAVLQDWLATDPPAEPAQRLLRELVQHVSLYHAIEEAFAP